MNYNLTNNNNKLYNNIVIAIPVDYLYINITSIS